MSSKIIKLLFIIIVSTLMFGCTVIHREYSYNQDDVLIDIIPAKISYSSGECGKAAVNQALYYYFGITEPDEELLNFSKYNDTLSLVRYAKDNGLVCELSRPDINDVFKDIDEGNPVISFIPVGKSLLGEYISKKFVSHSILLCGYSKDKNNIIFFSDGKGPFFMPLADFERGWNEMGRYAVRFNKQDSNI